MNENTVKVTKRVKSFKDLKNMPRKGYVELIQPDGEIIEMELQAVDSATLDHINDKYDKSKPKVPVKVMKVAGSAVPKQVEITEGADYEEYLERLKVNESMRMAELALAFIPENLRPEGTLEEQINELRTVLIAGHFVQIIKRGYEISGFNFDEKVEQAKNS